MRFLKNKIALAKALADVQSMERRRIRRTTQSDTPRSEPNSHELIKEHDDQTISKKRMKIPGVKLTPESTRSIKNISKNFARAICTFAISDMALPYLKPLLRQEYVIREDFVNFVHQIKPLIIGLFKFRSVLVTHQNDDQDVAAYKEVFRKIGEVFVKFFSVNWIYNGKLKHKEAHLRFRFKMLRAIRYPELFTFLRKKQCKPCKTKA